MFELLALLLIAGVILTVVVAVVLVGALAKLLLHLVLLPVSALSGHFLGGLAVVGGSLLALVALAVAAPLVLGLLFSVGAPLVLLALILWALSGARTVPAPVPARAALPAAPRAD